MVCYRCRGRNESGRGRSPSGTTCAFMMRESWERAGVGRVDEPPFHGTVRPIRRVHGMEEATVPRAARWCGLYGICTGD